jgi:hypothetical protein
MKEREYNGIYIFSTRKIVLNTENIDAQLKKFVIIEVVLHCLRNPEFRLNNIHI